MGCGCLVFLNILYKRTNNWKKTIKNCFRSKLNAQAAQIYEKIKEKEKMSDDTKTLNEIKEIGKKMEYSISEYFDRAGIRRSNNKFWLGIYFNWQKKVRNAWCMPGGKIAVYTGILKQQKILMD